MWTKGLSTTRKDSANNKSNYSEKGLPNLDSRSRRFRLERVFGERGCQEHFSPSAGCAGLFRDIQPLSPWKTLVWCPAPGLFHRSSCIFFSSDDADQFRNAFKPYGCRVATMDLSEARGLVLFRVVRRGIGITRRLSVTDTCAPTGD